MNNLECKNNVSTRSDAEKVNDCPRARAPTLLIEDKM